MLDTRYLSDFLAALIVLATAAGFVLDGNQQGTVVILVLWCVVAKPQTPLLARRCLPVWPLPLLAVGAACVDTRALWNVDPMLVGLVAGVLGTGLGVATVHRGSFLHRTLFPPDPTLMARFQRFVAHTAWAKGHTAPNLFVRANPAIGLVDVSAHHGTDGRKVQDLVIEAEAWLCRALERASFDPQDPLLPHGVGEDGNTIAPVPGLVETAHEKLQRLARTGQT